MAYDNTIKNGDGDDTKLGDSDGDEGNEVINSGDGDDPNSGDLGDDTINNGNGGRYQWGTIPMMVEMVMTKRTDCH